MAEPGTTRVGWGAVAHVFVAVALALPVAAAALAIGVAMTMNEQSMLNRWLLALLGVGFCVIVTGVALLPPVRQVEVATARALLGLALPDVPDPSARRSRLAGGGWLGILVVAGLVVGLAVLYLLPTGVGLLAHPFTGADELHWPGRTGVWHTGSGWSAAWVAPIGLAALALLVGVVWSAARLLVRWAPRMLGPTVDERLALAATRERDLARANALARDVHDTIGHALTAMTVQASAARRLLERDPTAADRALAEIERLGRTAQADVDSVVGALRAGDEPGALRPAPAASVDHAPWLRALATGLPAPVRLTLPDPLLLPPEIADTVEAVVREGLTNAVRHGGTPITVQVAEADGRLRVAVGNPAGETDPGGAREGRGLVGLRERLLLHDGALGAGPETGGEWWLRAEIPR